MMQFLDKRKRKDVHIIKNIFNFFAFPMQSFRITFQLWERTQGFKKSSA